MASRVSVVCVFRNPAPVLKLCDNRNKPYSLTSLAKMFDLYVFFPRAKLRKGS